MSPTDLPTRAPDIDGAYVVTAGGALLGGGAGAAIGFLLGSAYASRYMPTAGLEAVIPLAIAQIAGVWLGAVAGAWLLLSLKSAIAPRTTAFLLAGALPAWGIVSLPSFFWLTQQLAGDDGIPDLVRVAVPIVILCVPPALGARALVVERERRSEREETFT